MSAPICPGGAQCVCREGWGHKAAEPERDEMERVLFPWSDELVRRLALELVDAQSPTANGNECRYCALNIAWGDERKPDEHKVTCPWARLLRCLQHTRIDAGVT